MKTCCGSAHWVMLALPKLIATFTAIHSTAATPEKLVQVDVSYI